jgi:adenylate kinase
MVRKVLCNNEDSIKGYILDGFPRTLNQAVELDKVLESLGEKISAVLALVTDDEVNIRRIQHRANIEGRKDDADFDTIRNRIRTYHKVTEPLITYYKSQKKYKPVSGELSVEENFRDICKIIDSE